MRESRRAPRLARPEGFPKCLSVGDNRSRGSSSSSTRTVDCRREFSDRDPSRLALIILDRYIGSAPRSSSCSTRLRSRTNRHMFADDVSSYR